MSGLKESERGDSVDFEELAEVVEILGHRGGEGAGDSAVVMLVLLLQISSKREREAGSYAFAMTVSILEMSFRPFTASEALLWSFESMCTSITFEALAVCSERRACEEGEVVFRTPAMMVLLGRLRRAVTRPSPIPRLAPVMR